jgi:hypothetical protein
MDDSGVLDISLGVTTLSFSVFARSVSGVAPPVLSVYYQDEESDYNYCVGFSVGVFSLDTSVSGYNYKAVITVRARDESSWPVGADAHVYLLVYTFDDVSLIGVIDLTLVGLQEYFFPISSGLLSNPSL